jgi:hypothetical protein
VVVVTEIKPVEVKPEYVKTEPMVSAEPFTTVVAPKPEPDAIVYNALLVLFSVTALLPINASPK